MPKDFYQGLSNLEAVLKHKLTIGQRRGGHVLWVSPVAVSADEQLEMLTPQFFVGEAHENPIKYKFRKIFQRTGLLPCDEPEVPLMRDIALREQSSMADTTVEHPLFAQFLREHTLPNQWSSMFPGAYSAYQEEIRACYQAKPEALEVRHVTTAPDGTPLQSGGYTLKKHMIQEAALWLRFPEDDSEPAIASAIERTLNDTENTQTMLEFLILQLRDMPVLAFNVRGVGANALGAGSAYTNLDEVMTNAGVQGGHQHLLVLDRTTKTLFEVNDSIMQGSQEDTEENLRAFKAQLDIFLRGLGDENEYTVKLLDGRSRPKEALLRQPCNISQFLSYAAILSGVRPEDIQADVPTKVSVLLYLISYASRHPEDESLQRFLEEVADELEQQLNAAPAPEAKPQPRGAEPHSDPAPQQATNYAFVWDCLYAIGVGVLGGALLALSMMTMNPWGIALGVATLSASAYGLYASCTGDYDNAPDGEPELRP